MCNKMSYEIQNIAIQIRNLATYTGTLEKRILEFEGLIDDMKASHAALLAENQALVAELKAGYAKEFTTRSRILHDSLKAEMRALLDGQTK